MNTRLIGRLIVAIECIILIGVVVHAPLSVWLGVSFPQYLDLIKSWKEILLGVCTLLLVIYIYRIGKWRGVFDDWVIRLAGMYGLLHIVLLGWQSNSVAAAAAGLLIDLRYVLFFVIVYLTVRLLPTARRPLLVSGLAGALIFTVFAMLQVFVLPPDILAHIGYSKATITPYLTVDLNHSYIRINSTLRGPNPVGAYAGMCLALVTAYVIARRRTLSHGPLLLSGLLLIGSLVAVWASYSRSALVGAVIAFLVVLIVATVKHVSRGWWITGVVIILAIIGGIFAARDTAFVSNVLLHENPAGGSAEKSNEGHVESLQDGTARLLRQPLGGGIGSTGSASLRSDEPLIIENQYLFIAHETGWIGLGLFGALFGLIMFRLWRNRADWLALGLFGGGVGITLIGLLLPVWADDTVSIIWWGLAGVALGYVKVKSNGKRSKSIKKTA